MPQTQRLLPFYLLVSLACLLSFAPPAAGQSKLNVLLIVVDDLRNDLGCYGHPLVKTPNIDRLAARSVLFERAYAQYPVCNPSRSSFLSGLRPDQTGVYDNLTMLRSKRLDVVTLPQLFKQNGYHTASFGKVFHVGGVKDPELRATWIDQPFSWHDARVFSATPAGQIVEGRNLTGDKLAWCSWGATAGTDDDQPDGQVAQATIDQITRRKDQPWFLGVGFYKPHDPFVAPRKYFDLYPLESVQFTRDPADMTAAPPIAIGFGEMGKAFRAFSDLDRREYLRSYYACISFMDAQVGRVLDTLDRQQLWDNTIVIFMGDHGYHLGQRDWWNKNTLYEHSCRAPLIVAAPGCAAGAARGLVEFIDLYPTLADLCALPAPQKLAGTSFRSLLEDPQRSGKPFAHTVVTHGRVARGDSVRTDRWRYTEWSDGSRELYDHDHDPEEWHNVVGRREHQSAVAELQRLLKSVRPAAE
jgi:uncharacterized sulfatase